jgi:hypothetical protein
MTQPLDTKYIFTEYKHRKLCFSIAAYTNMLDLALVSQCSLNSDYVTLKHDSNRSMFSTERKPRN